MLYPTDPAGIHCNFPIIRIIILFYSYRLRIPNIYTERLGRFKCSRKAIPLRGTTKFLGYIIHC